MLPKKNQKQMNLFLDYGLNSPGACRRRLASSPAILALISSAALIAITLPSRAASFNDWQHRQDLTVETPGLLKLSLPPETLEAARAGLEDLRLLDPLGAEVPYALERLQPGGKVVRPAKTFRVSLNNRSTIISLETGLTLLLEAVTLGSPAASFIKAAQIEGSADQENWKTIAAGQPIFRQNGVAQLQLPVSGAWPYLRITINDQRSDAVPFTSATLHFAEALPIPSEPLPVTIIERVENPGQTRLALSLGAANLDLASLRFETTESLFTRKVTVAMREVSENSITERSIAECMIYRVELDGQPASAKLAVSVERVVPAREVLVLIQNDDSPPLEISRITAERHPVRAIFQARQSGTFAVLTGNKSVASPRYDLGALRASFQNLSLSPLKLSAIGPNPSYRAPEALPELQDIGAALDTAAWRFRKPLPIASPGVQQVELDLEVMARAQPAFSDLRLVRDGKQLPYILEHPSITRSLAPVVSSASDPKKPQQSRWSLKLPQSGLPATQLVCEARTPLFQRELRLYEMAADDRGREYERPLGAGSWMQTPDRRSKQFTLHLSGTPTTDTLFLETDNGDNPPVELANFKLYYHVTRALFKTTSTTPMHLYYGNHEAEPPRYDLSLVTAQVLLAAKTEIALGPQEQLKKAEWNETAHAGAGSAIFWGILGLVVVALLVLISRLLPKQAPPPG
jgi:hypothetical protein